MTQLPSTPRTTQGCIVLSYLRVFSFLQFYELLNILTETIKLAVGELLGVMYVPSHTHTHTHTPDPHTPDPHTPDPHPRDIFSPLFFAGFSVPSSS